MIYSLRRMHAQWWETIKSQWQESMMTYVYSSLRVQVQCAIYVLLYHCYVLYDIVLYQFVLKQVDSPMITKNTITRWRVWIGK